MKKSYLNIPQTSKLILMHHKDAMVYISTQLYFLPWWMSEWYEKFVLRKIYSLSYHLCCISHHLQILCSEHNFKCLLGLLIWKFHGLLKFNGSNPKSSLFMHTRSSSYIPWHHSTQLPKLRVLSLLRYPNSHQKPGLLNFWNIFLLNFHSHHYCRSLLRP